MPNHGFQPPGSGPTGVARDPWPSRGRGIASSILLVISLLPGCAGSRGNGGSSPGADPAAIPGGSATAPGAADPDSLPQLSPAELAALKKGPPELRGTAVLFTYVSHRARTVAVAGTFNGWIPTANPLARRALAPAAGAAAPPDSLWYALVPVPRGRHRYKFLVDGNRWLLDPANPKQSGDGSGGVASILDMR